MSNLNNSIKLCVVKLVLVDIVPDCDVLICMTTRIAIVFYCTNQHNYVTKADQWYLNMFKNLIQNLLPVAILSRRISVNKSHHALIEKSYDL